MIWKPGRLFRKQGRLFRKPGRLFGKQGRHFRKPGRLFRKPGRLFRTPGRLFGKPGKLFGWSAMTNFQIFPMLKGFATFWEFSFYRQKKVANYEFYILFAEKIHLHSYFFIFYVLKPRSFSSNPTLKGFATFWEF